MLSLTDCVDFIDLDGDTIDVIAEHEHVPAMVAAELGSDLIASAKGLYCIHQMHRELIARAAASNRLDKERVLRRIYAAFTRKYPMPRHL